MDITSFLYVEYHPVGHVNEYPRMHYFGDPTQTFSHIQFWKFQ